MRNNNTKVFILYLFVIVLFGSTYVLGQRPSSIPIETQRNKTVIPVKVGNSRILKILLDTGMSFDGLLLYNKDLLDSIKLNNPIEVRVAGAGSGKPSTALMDTSANFSISDYEFYNQKLLILTSDIYKGFPTDGVLGYSIFGHYAVEIDYDKNIMILHDYDILNIDESWESIPIYFKNNTIPWIDVSVAIEKEDPVTISTYVDFAAGETIELLEKENMKVTLPAKLEEAHLGRGLSGDIYGKIGIISKLIIGPYELNRIKAAFVSSVARSKQSNADGIIGNGSLKYFNLIFDYKNKKLFLKPNAHYLSDRSDQ
ncbi:hypothetical protein ACFL0J_00630 [Candidatus Neomarinimicrobiota bacterium]